MVFVMRALGADLSPARLVYVLFQLAALLAMPCVFRGIDHGSVSPRNFYIVWWLIGMMPLVREAAVRIWGEGHSTRVSGVAGLYLGLPWVSLISHLGILHYVYDVDYMAAMAAPLLLGLTLTLNHMSPSTFGTKRELLALRVILPIIAIMVSLGSPHQLTFSFGETSPRYITTAILGISGAYLTYVYCFFLPIAIWMLGIGVVVGGSIFFGPSWIEIQRTIWRIFDWMMDVLDRMLPKTMVGWGVISVMASFFFLVIGAAVSLSAPKVRR